MSLFVTREHKNFWMSKFKEDLIYRISDSDFKKNVINLLHDVNPDKIKITESGIEYTTREKIPRMISISILDDGVFYTEESEKRIKTGRYYVDESGKMYIKYTETDITIYKDLYYGKKNKKYNTCNICRKTHFHTFNNEGIEIWRLEETNQDNYFQNKKTKEQIMTPPDYFKNYTEKEYSFRAADKIIKRIIKQYHSPINEDTMQNANYYLIGDNYYPTNKKIPRGGEYIYFPKELFSRYKLGECSIDLLWENRGREKVKKQ